MSGDIFEVNIMGVDSPVRIPIPAGLIDPKTKNLRIGGLQIDLKLIGNGMSIPPISSSNSNEQMGVVNTQTYSNLQPNINYEVEVKGKWGAGKYVLEVDSEDFSNDGQNFLIAPSLGNISVTPIEVKGFVGKTDKMDLYEFTVPPNNQSKITVTLSGLKDTAGISFYNSGNIGTGFIATDFGYTPINAADKSVTIPENLKPGNYFVRVEPEFKKSGTASTPYTLTLKADTNATPTISTIAFSDANYTVNENGTKAIVTLKRNGPTGIEHRAELSFDPGTPNPAIKGEDYTEPPLFSLAVIPADKDSATIEIPILNDNKQEGDETIKLTLTTPGITGSPLGRLDTATLTIKDDDSPTRMPVPTPTPTGTPTPTPTGTPTPTPTGTPTPTPTGTPTPTPILGTPVSIAAPAINAPAPGNPTGQPANTVNGQFYNLSDSNDNISLSSLPPAAAGKQILALSGNDKITGTSGIDNINGMQGADTIDGGAGSDSLSGGKGSDEIDGGAGDDQIFGHNDNDTLTGGDGNDNIRGGKENDVVIGGLGDDTLSGDRGQDILTGGGGSDTFILAGGQAAAARLADADVIVDFTVGDRIGITDGNTFASLTFEAVSLNLNGGSAVSATAIKLGTNYLGIVQGVAQSELTANVFVVNV